MIYLSRMAIAACLLTLLAGCDDLGAFDRADAWHATGVNKSNLAAMAANPADLAHGRGTEAADGYQAAAAIDRLRNGRVKPLLDSSSSGSSSSAAPSPAVTSGPN